jgi:hypothetical protein
MGSWGLLVHAETLAQQLPVQSRQRAQGRGHPDKLPETHQLAALQLLGPPPPPPLPAPWSPLLTPVEDAAARMAGSSARNTPGGTLSPSPPTAAGATHKALYCALAVWAAVAAAAADVVGAASIGSMP